MAQLVQRGGAAAARGRKVARGVNFGHTRDRDGSPKLVRRDVLGLVALMLLLLWLAPALARAQGADSLIISWTAPGDDGTAGTASVYELRIANFAMTAATFSSGMIVPGVPDPTPAGSRQSFILRGLTRGTPYWLGLRTMDDAGNWSAVSNIVPFTWPPDAAPPSAPSGVAAELISGTSTVRVAWSPNSEADLAGYNVYRATAPEGPWSKVASPRVSDTQWVDGQLPSGVDALWYAVSAFDRSGGEGARSAASQVVLKSSLPGAPTAWGIQAAYPNPARVGDVMRIPIEIPATGGSAHVLLLDGAGRQVRRFDLGGNQAGIDVLAWDGLNDAGRPCVPGVYRAVLIAPGASRSVNVARVP